MNHERILKLMKGPRISEKATLMADSNAQHVFMVHQSAAKAEIKEAVELLFDVKVKQVRTLNQEGKKKNHGRRQGQRSGFKKAYVSLCSGYDIDYGLGEK